MVLPHSQGFPDGEVEVAVGAGGDQMDQIVFTVDINQFARAIHHGNTGDPTRLKLVHCLRQFAALGGDLLKM